MAGFWSSLGTNLERAVACYNQALGSLESPVLVTARKFKELEATAGQSELEELSPIEGAPRAPQAPELMVIPNQKKSL